VIDDKAVLAFIYFQKCMRLLYDRNMLPIGRALWLKELASYITFPPLQIPASYNLEQVVQQVREIAYRK